MDSECWEIHLPDLSFITYYSHNPFCVSALDVYDSITLVTINSAWGVLGVNNNVYHHQGGGAPALAAVCGKDLATES